MKSCGRALPHAGGDRPCVARTVVTQRGATSASAQVAQRVPNPTGCMRSLPMESRTLSCSSFTHHVWRQLRLIRLPFARFLLGAAGAKTGAGPPNTDLWPCPLPPMRASGSGRRCDTPSARAARACLRLLVGALNWLVLGRGGVSAEVLVAGRPPSAAQRSMLGRMESFCRSWALTVGPGTALKRHLPKLICMESTIRDLTAMALNVKTALLPYGTRVRCSSERAEGSRGGGSGASLNAGHERLVPEKVKMVDPPNLQG